MATQNFLYKSPNGINYHRTTVDPSPKAHPFYTAESHQVIELLYVVQGKMYSSIDGSQLTVNEGDMIVINAGEFHASRVSHETVCERLNLHFSPNHLPSLKNDLASLFTKTSLYQHVLPKEFISKTKIVPTLKKIETLCRKSDKYKDLRIISLIQTLVAEINTVVESLMQKSYHYIAPPTATNELFQSAIDYINKHIQENVTPPTIAQYLGVSESYLHRLFKKYMGISIHKYVENQKMQLALSLLRKGHSAQNVAEMLGYDYYTTFFSQFKRVFEKAPNELK